MNNLDETIRPLLNLRADRSHGWDGRTRGQAPHKPFLLLSILDGIEQGWITDNRVEISQELIDTFFTYWNAVMDHDQITTIALPFYHMKSEPFWELEYNTGEKEYKSSPSLGGLKDRVAYAVIDPGLYSLMKDNAGREKIRNLLAGHYFSEETTYRLMEIGSMNFQAWRYSDEIVSMVAEPFVAYRTDKNKRKLVERYAQIREAGFTATVRKSYDYNCAVCRNRLVTPGGSTLVEGAHIIPWSMSNNDDPRNGMSLCRSHHWMFDNMMLTIREDFTIRTSYWMERNGNSVEETVKLKNREILVPDDTRFQPSVEALLHHNERFEEFHSNN